MPLYEIMCIATLRSSPAQLVHLLSKLSVVVHKGKGVFRRVEHLGTRPLATRMKAHMKYNTVGRYVRLYIQASPLLCADVETRLRVDDNIVRTMTIKHQQAAPVVVEKRVHNMKILDSASTTGILTHAPIIEYHAARALLSLGMLSGDDILSLPRYRPDAQWDELRSNELLRREALGSAPSGAAQIARALVQVPIPTRKQDLKMMKDISDAEEEEMIAYEGYRKSNNERKVAAADKYIVDENAAKDRRVGWYNARAHAEIDRKRVKAANGGRQVPRGPERDRRMAALPFQPFKNKLKRMDRPIVTPEGWTDKHAE